MKRYVPLLFLFAGCTPDIEQSPPPPPSVTAEFAPGNVAVAIAPAPNDLALTTGKIVVPVPHGCLDYADPAAPKKVPAPGAPASASNGLKDEDETDVDCGGHSTNACDADKACQVAEDCASTICTGGKCVGGCPSAAQQEFNRQYLGTLSGFPFESTATTSFSHELNPATVSPTTVLGIDITNPASPVPVPIAPTYGNKVISIAPPNGAWTRGHRYAIVLVGGPNGLKGAAGEPVLGSATWALVSSKTPLVTCADLSAPDCRSAVDVITSQLDDPFAQFQDATNKAKQLEQIRRGFDPLLTALEAKNGLPRDAIPLAWTFTIIDAGEMTFDPARSVIPFPNDILRNPTTNLVTLPNPTTGKPLTATDCAAPTDLQLALVCGLNTLDGFSTLAPLISENSDTLGAATQATIDAASLDTKSVGLLPLKHAVAAETTAPSYTPCLNCRSSKSASGQPQTAPQQLQWSLAAPLDENATYLGYTTNAVRDDKGKPTFASPTFALLRSTQPLSVNGKSTVTLLSDAQAAQLEPLRAALKPALDGLAATGVTREMLNLAFGFTTQSEASTLSKLYGLPAAAGAAGLPGDPVGLGDVTAPITAAAAAAGIPAFTNVDKFFTGVMLSPVLLTGTGGAFNSDPAKAAILPVAFLIATPKTPGPWPVTITSHGFTHSRNQFLPLADALTGAGQMMVSVDIVFHGERTSCTGSKTATAAALPPGATPSDDFACAAPAAAGGNMKCDEGSPVGLCVLVGGTRDACAPGPVGDGTCAAKGQGRCAADQKCQGVVGAPVDCATGGSAKCAGMGLGLCDRTTNLCQGSTAGFARDATTQDPKISGWNMFNLTNFFATRDNFRQEVIDMSQLVRVLQGTGATSFTNQLSLANGAPVTIDTTKTNFVGLSLGGINGSLFNAVTPVTNNVVLNVTGGALTRLFLESPTLAPQRKVFLDTLAAAGIQQGTPQFDTFIGTTQWILDPADPVNIGYRLTHPADTGSGLAPNANRKVFIQFIEGDAFVINESSLALIASANRSFAPAPPSYGCAPPLFCWEFVSAGATSTTPAGGSPPFDTTSAPIAERHEFLVSPPSASAAGVAITTAAQKQVATFIATGVGP